MARIPIDQPYSTAQSIPFGAADSAAKYGKHAGIDYAVPTGRSVYAPASGRVTGYVGGISTYQGKTVEIYSDGVYLHMFHNAEIKVTPGQWVNEGDIVALSGATGLGITGPHLHFGVAKKSIPQITSFADYIDPNIWLNQGGYMGFNYNSIPTDAEKTKYIEGMTGRPVTGPELANKQPWGEVNGVVANELKTQVSALQKKIKDLTDNPPGFTKVTEELFRKS